MINSHDITTELYREYRWINKFGHEQVIRIDNPMTLFIREGGATHRILREDGVVFCVPSPHICGVVLSWKNKDVTKPCEF